MHRCGIFFLIPLLLCVAGCTPDEITIKQPDLLGPEILEEPVGFLEISLSIDTTFSWYNSPNPSTVAFFLQGEYFEDIESSGVHSYSGQARNPSSNWDPVTSDLEMSVWRGEGNDVFTWQTEELPLGSYILTVVQVIGGLAPEETYRHHLIEVKENSNAYVFQFPVEVP